MSTAAKSAHRAVRLAVQAGELTRPQTCTRCGGPFVLVDFWGGTEGMVYAEHELEPA